MKLMCMTQLQLLTIVAIIQKQSLTDFAKISQYSQVNVCAGVTF